MTAPDRGQARAPEAVDFARLVDEARVEELPGLAGALEVARVKLQLRLVAAPPASKPAPAPTVDETISVAEAARRLGVSKDFVYKTRGKLPFVAQIGRRVVCSASGVERFRSARMGRAHGSR